MPAELDSHVHLWDLDRCAYEWIQAGSVLDRSFGPADLRAMLGPGDASAIIVQAANSRCDMDALSSYAASEPRIAGAVGWLDLRDPAALETRLASPPPKLVGLRHVLFFDPDPAFLQLPAVRASLSTLAASNLVFEVTASFPRWFADLVALAEALPDLRLVLDHLGGPPLGAERQMAAWKDALAQVAAAPNVSVKLSGFATAAYLHDRWTVEDLLPAAECTFEAFGPERVMYGSDWPVCNLAGGPEMWRAAAGALVDRFAPAARDAVFGATARRVFQLG